MLSSGAAACLLTSLFGTRSPRKRLGPAEPKIFSVWSLEKGPTFKSWFSEAADSRIHQRNSDPEYLRLS